MSALVAFLGMRGAIVAAVLGACLAIMTGVAGWQWFRAEAAIVARGGAENAKGEAENSLAVCVRANESAAAAEDARKRMAEENTRVYMAALDNAREAAEKARRDKAYAESLLSEWRATWGGKTPTCAAALATLDNACKELEAY
jgi:hypothetical protein